MSESVVLSSVAVAAVVIGTLVAGSMGMRRARTTGDFYVASRSVSPRWNAAAIGGEYLSAASFLGVAGLVLAYGLDMLWYPVCYTAGYLVLLALVAAPLRRSGAYTLPDFAQIRLGSPVVRRIASALVVLIGWLYLLPQLDGASLALRTETGAPRWLGGLLVAVVVVIAVTIGGMRSITFAQALQFWLKFLALLIPALVLAGIWFHRGDSVGAGHPTARSRILVNITAAETVRVSTPETLAVTGQVDGVAVDGPTALTIGEHRLGAGTKVTLERGDTVPVITDLPTQSTASWLAPLGSGIDHPLYATLSLILAICLGTMGLPHVLVRFYTNPDGRDARRTTLVVLGLLSAFYLLPTVFGVLGRRYVPDLLLTGNTDATVLELPGRMLGGTGGLLLSALVSAGAFAAFLSTASGLTVSVAGVLSQDLFKPRERRRRDRFRDSRQRDRLRDSRQREGDHEGIRRRRIRSFRLAAVLGIAVPYVLSLPGGHLNLAVAVGLAFAVAAATFCPLLVLGIWWPKLTAAGATAGLVTGGVLATTAVLVTIVDDHLHGWWGVLLTQPAAWAVPLTFVVMVGVSLATPRRIPPHVGRIMLRLHAPESLAEQLAAAAERRPLVAGNDRSAHSRGRMPTAPHP